MPSRAAIQMRPGAGPHNLHKKKAEKIKDFKGTVKRLVGYLIEKKASILIVFIFIILFKIAFYMLIFTHFVNEYKTKYKMLGVLSLG